MRKLWTKNSLSRVVFAGLILVVVILGCLVGTGSPSSSPKLETVGLMQALTVAYANYVTNNGPLQNLDNQSFLKALSGENSKKVYMSFKPSQIDSHNELKDGWGTPLHISYLSGSGVKIVSAGPDKIFGTEDDITNQ